MATKQHIVKCRICGQEFDTNTLTEGEDWIMPSKNWYYHVKCYTDWKVADSLRKLEREPTEDA